MIQSISKKFQKQQSCNITPWSARNLSKKDLAGVIFACKKSTFRECVTKLLFGLPGAHFAYVQNVSKGMPLFLYNCTNKKMYGIFEAVSCGQMEIDKHAWTSDGSEITQFPAQVRMKILMECNPLVEDQYKPILAKNYALKDDPHWFWYELDLEQTQKLISLLSASPVSQNETKLCMTDKWGPLFKRSIDPMVNSNHSSTTHMHLASSSTSAANAVRKPVSEVDPGKSWSSLFKAESVSKSDEENENSNDSMSEAGIDRDVAPAHVDVPASLYKTRNSMFLSESEFSEEDEDSNGEGLSDMSEGETHLLSESTCVVQPPVMLEATRLEQAPVFPQTNCMVEAPQITSETNCSISEMNSESQTNLCEVLSKLLLSMGEIKSLQLTQTQKIECLEQGLAQTNSKLLELEHQHVKSAPSISCHPQEFSQAILLIGGFNGSSWLQHIVSYLPSEDKAEPLVSINSVRPCACAVELNGKLYVFGGGQGASWYDTVESYNMKDHQWVSYPVLRMKRGSLAGASLLGKIFAIGGGNETGSLSEVEMFDLEAGKWIFTRSMAQKRSAPAAAGLNGVLYVSGGYDGQEYLRTMERYDPREHHWTRLPSMNASRGCHSLTVLNEKLYAIGGYDGAQMVNTVEVFEPRVGSWMMAESMASARGYLGAVTQGNNIYAIGGMGEKDVLDTVEIYSEGKGWQQANLKSVGKRCYFSAVVVTCDD